MLQTSRDRSFEEMNDVNINLCPITFLSRGELDPSRIYEVDRARNIFYDVVALNKWLQSNPRFPHNREPVTIQQLDCILNQIESMNTILLYRIGTPPTFDTSGCVTYQSEDGKYSLRCFGNGHVAEKPSGYKISTPYLNPWMDDVVTLKKIPMFGEWAQRMKSSSLR